MPDNPPLVSTPQAPSSPLKFLLILLVVLAIVAWGLWNFFLKGPSTQEATVTTTPMDSLSFPPSSFDNCAVKEGHPLLSGVEKTETVISGTVSGKIENIYPESEGIAVLQIVSQDGSVSLPFRIVTPDVVVTKDNNDIALDKLKTGEAVLLSFTCDPVAKGNFRITKVLIVTPESL